MTKVKDVITACNTARVRGLSRQIIAEMNLVIPNALVDVSDLIQITGSAVNPFLQPAAREALRHAVEDKGGAKPKVASAYRTIAQQYLLFQQFKQGLCGIPLAAKPGNSNHEDGLALDIQDHAAFKAALQSHQWHHLGAADPPHFDFIGTSVRHDISVIAITAFQRLWNRHNPDDQITADGAFGPQTEARLRESPAEGFGAPRVLSLEAGNLMSGPDVGRVQKALTAAGFAVAVSNTFDQATEQAVKAFQEAKGLKTDGVVGIKTRQALGIAP